MNNKNKVATLVILGALVVALGSVLVAQKLGGNKEERSMGDMIDEERRITDVTIDGDKLVYKDNSVKYVKYVILDYVVNTNYFVEDAYYWFNSEEEYKTNLRNLTGSVIDYNPETLMIRTMSDVKEMNWLDKLSELKSANVTIIR